MELWSSRFNAWVAALLVLTAGPLLVMAPLVDAFAVFGAAGAGAIWCSTRAVRTPSPGPWLVAAGALVGLATLARVDGLLLAAAPAAAWATRRDWPSGRARVGWGFGSAAGRAAGACSVARSRPGTFGSAFPSAGGHTLWITSYNQQFSIGQDPTLAGYLAWGPLNIIGSKLGGWGELLGRPPSSWAGIFVFFFFAGLWRERRRPELGPSSPTSSVMFLAMGAVFTFHAPKGAFYHSSLAWLPFARRSPSPPAATATTRPRLAVPAPTATIASSSRPRRRRSGGRSRWPASTGCGSGRTRATSRRPTTSIEPVDPMPW